MTTRSPRSVVVAAGVTFAPLAALGTACVNFDREEQIEDVRVLAVKTEPAEVLFSPLYLTPPERRPPIPLPSTDITVEVFAFDPRGGLVRTSVAACPEGAGDSSCRLYDKDADPDFAALVEPARSEVAALLTPVVVEAEIDPAATPVGRTAPSTFQFTLTPGAIDFFQPKDANGQNAPSIFPLLPRFTVAVENLTARAAGEAVVAERAFKRLPLTLDLADPTLPAEFLADLGRAIGVELCGTTIPTDDTFVQGRAACLYGRGPNANPPLTGFVLEPTDVLDVEEALATGMVELPPTLGLGSLLRADAGTAIALTPVWGPGAAERYQVLSFDIDSSKLVVENRVEDLACQWFVTRGTVARTQTALEFTRDRLGNVWTLPTDAVAGERDSLVLIALDQRGGTAVAEVTVEYR
jgi:hypothetical protein